MPTTVYATLDDDTQMWYDKTQLVRAKPNLVHHRFGQQRPLPARSTRKILMRRYNALAANITQLTEGVTPAGKSLAKTDVSATAGGYGDFVTVSDLATFASRDPVLTEAAEVLGQQMGESLDQVWRDILVAGTNVFVATDSAGATSSTRTDCDGLINATFCDKLIRKLQQQNAKTHTRLVRPGTGIGSAAIFPAYWGILHPDVYYTARGMTGWTAVKDYASQQEIQEGEVGAYRDIRFVMTTHAKKFADGGNATIPAGMQGTTAVDVFATLVFGTEAYGVVPLTGHNTENIAKPLGSGDDPLNQRATSGWKAYTTAVILNDNFMVRGEMGAST